MSEPSLTRRRFLGATTALAVGGVVPFLGGCGRSSVPPPTLRVHLRLSAYERAFFTRTILPPFERARNVRVALGGGTTDEAIGALHEDAGRFDLVGIDTEQLGLLLADHLVSDVNDQRTALDAAIPSNILAALEQGGKLHALPYRPTTWVTFYNSALLGAAGVAPPRTWDELLVVAGKVRDDKGGKVALQGAASAAGQSLVELVWAFGGDPLTLDDAGSRAAADFLARLAPLLAPATRDANFDTLTRDLGTDRVALGPNWPVVATDLLQRGGKPDLAVSATIAGPLGRPRVLSGQVLIVPTGAQQRDHALALAAHLRGQEIQRTLARELAWFPAREDTFDSAPTWQQGVASAAREALRTARALPPLAQRADFDLILGTAFRQIAFEGILPPTALATAAARLPALR